MYESPIQMVSEDIIKDIVEKQDGYLIELVHRCGFDVNEEELKRALLYDRNQWERGYIDGKMDGYHLRDVEIVRCHDCKHRGTDDCPMYFEEQVEWEEDGGYIERDTIYHDYTEDGGFCDRGERREDATD